jgi:hypothetical protein
MQIRNTRISGMITNEKLLSTEYHVTIIIYIYISLFLHHALYHAPMYLYQSEVEGCYWCTAVCHISHMSSSITDDNEENNSDTPWNHLHYRLQASAINNVSVNSKVPIIDISGTCYFYECHTASCLLLYNLYLLQ